jgi:DNA-binding response OmpR family regulator
MTEMDKLPARQHDGLPVLTGGDVELDVAAHKVTVRRAPVSLTPQEFRLLQALMEHVDRVMTSEELLTSLWGPDYAGDPSTLVVHIMRLRTKLERRLDAEQHIRTIRGVGYIFDSTSPGSPPE